MTASGVGAIAQTLLALTKQGDHILCFVETYNPSRYLIRRLLGRFGVTHTMLSIEDLAGHRAGAGRAPDAARVVREPDQPGDQDCRHRRAHPAGASAPGALMVMDNTFAGFHQHGEYEVDLFVHSLTKYASGAGDVMGGAVIGAQELIRSMRTDFGTLGGTLDPHAAFLILRGLKTYFVRYQAQCASAQRIAELLAATPRWSACTIPAADASATCAGAARR